MGSLSAAPSGRQAPNPSSSYLGGPKPPDKIRLAYCRWFSSIVEPLNEQERQQLVFLLEKIRTRLNELARTVGEPDA